MLLWFVVIYWIISVAIGIYAAKWVHSTKDYAIAGRRMPMYIVTATVFATWLDRKSTRLNSSHIQKSRMPSSA